MDVRPKRCEHDLHRTGVQEIGTTDPLPPQVVVSAPRRQIESRQAAKGVPDAALAQVPVRPVPNAGECETPAVLWKDV